MIRNITVLNFLFNLFFADFIFVILLPRSYTQELPPTLRYLLKHRVFHTKGSNILIDQHDKIKASIDFSACNLDFCLSY